MEKYRLNMQIGNLMQHITFPNEDSARAALAEIFKCKGQDARVTALTAFALVDPTTVSFAEVRKI